MINVQELEGRVLPVRFRPQSAFLLPADEAVKAEHLCEINVVYADVKKGLKDSLLNMTGRDE